MYRAISLAAIACFAIASLIILSPAQALAATSGNMKDQKSQQTQSVQQTIPVNRKRWQIIASPNIGNIGSQLNGVAAVGASDIWSVGEYYNPVYSTQTLVEHWNGSTWQLVTSPNNGMDINQLNGVAAVTTNNVWTVGFYRNGPLRTLIEHWNGARWSIIASPNVGNSHNQLEAVTALSANNIWAVGTYFDTHLNSNLTLIEHWNGTQWSVIASPNSKLAINNLAAIATVSANNIWAVGDGEDGIYQTLIEHWDGAKWSIVASPNVMNSNSILNGLSVLTANNIWAVGDYYDLNLHRDFTLVEHWDGAKWSIVASPNVGTDFCRLYGVAAIAANNVWAVGEDDQIPPAFTLTEHWNGTQWNIVPSPNLSTTFNTFAALIVVSGNSGP